jgi:hypothetical protein
MKAKCDLVRWIEQNIILKFLVSSNERTFNSLKSRDCSWNKDNLFSGVFQAEEFLFFHVHRSVLGTCLQFLGSTGLDFLLLWLPFTQVLGLEIVIEPTSLWSWYKEKPICLLWERKMSGPKKLWNRIFSQDKRYSLLHF